MATHQRGVVPVFQVCNNTREQVSLHPRLEPIEVAAERIFVVVVAAEYADFGVSVQARDEEADLGVEPLDRGFITLGVTGAARLNQVAATDEAIRVAGGAPPYFVAVVFGEVVVEVCIHPVGEDLQAQSELSKVVVAFAMDRVSINVASEDHIASRQPFAEAEAGAAEDLAVVLQVEARVEKEEGVARLWSPKTGEGVDVSAAEMLAELRAKGDRAARGQPHAGRDRWHHLFRFLHEGLAGLGNLRQKEGGKAEGEGEAVSPQ